MYTFCKNIIICFVLLSWSNVLLAQAPITYTVTKVLDDGTIGSFSYALSKAEYDNANSIIRFNISGATSTPIIRTTFEYSIGACRSEADLYSLEIDGTSQPTWRNIIFENAAAVRTLNCFVVGRSKVSIYGLHIRLFNNAILIAIPECPIGIRAAAAFALLYTDINIGKAPVGGIDYGNILVSNTYGIRLADYVGVFNLLIKNNYIGTDKVSTLNIGNTENISIPAATGGATTNNLTIEGNVLAGGRYGVLTARQVKLYSNFIGTNKTQSVNLRISGHGFYGYAATEISDIQNNVFANNGVALQAGSADLEAKKNIFYCNGLPLTLTTSPPTTPTITLARSNLIQGTGTAGNTVELFYNDNNCSSTSLPCQGKTIINAPKSITVAANGTWSYTPTTPLTLGATVTAQQHNTTGARVFVTKSSLFSTPCATVICPNNVSYTSNKIDVPCYGGADGALTLTMNPISTYTYRFRTTETATTSNQRTNLTAGNYTITITNTANNCAYTTSSPIAILQPSAPLDAICTVTKQLTSTTYPDATARVTVTGGTPPYIFSAINTTTGAVVTTVTTQPGGIYLFTDLRDGVYSINVKDSKYVASATAGNNGGCTDICTFTINPLNCTKLSATLSQLSPVQCAGQSNGTLSLNYNDSLLYLPLGIRWSHLTTVDSIRTLSATNTLTKSGIKAGQYSVTVTDKIGCSVVSSTKITQPDSLFATCDSTSAALKIGEASGSVWIDIKGGPLNYIILRISQGSTVKPDTIISSVGRFQISGFKKGKYLATVIRSSCQDTCAFTIDDPTCTLRSEFDYTEVSCFNGTDGSALLKPDTSSGKAPFTYRWAGSTIATPNRTGLRFGNYFFTVTDNQLCTYSDTITITQPNILTTTCLPADSVLTVGGRTGQGKFTFTGGTKPYFAKTYFVSNNSLAFQKDSLYADSVHTGRILPAGNYRTDIVDGNSCTVSCTFTVYEPNCRNLTVNTLKIDSLKCFNDRNASITVSATGGARPYRYAWSPNTATDSIANNLGIGTYSVTVTDDANCTATKPFTITQPTQLKVDTVVTQLVRVDVNNGRIVLNVSGGTPTYTVTMAGQTATGTPPQYIFSNLGKGTYKYTVTDAKGCTLTDSVVIREPSCSNLAVNTVKVDSLKCFNDKNAKITISVTGGTRPYRYAWSNTANDSIVNNLGSGRYSVTITDSKGCVVNAVATISEPTLLRSTFSTIKATRADSQDGIVEVVVSGGTQSYTVLLGSRMATVVNATTFRFTGLAVGRYGYTVTDAKGCTTSDSVAIEGPICSLRLSRQIDSVRCNGTATGRIVLTATNAKNPLVFNWSPNVSTTTNTANNLSAGTYFTTVTDADGCMAYDTIKVFEPTALSSTAAAMHIIIANQPGSIQVVVSGGTQPYVSVKMGTTNATVVNSTTFNFAGLVAGTYTYIVTDAKGCTTEKTVVINPLDCNVNLRGVADSVRCNGENNGKIVLTPTNSTGVLRFSWSPNTTSTADTANNLRAGTYNATVTDARGCIANTSVTVLEPALLSSTFNKTNVRVPSGSDGTISIKVAGGTPQYKVQLLQQTATFSNDSFRFTGLVSGSYTYTVTDAKGCTTTGTVVINGVNCSTITAQVSIGQAITCFGATDGSINLTTNAQTPQYKWSNGSTLQNLIGVGADTYKVTVTDAQNCTQTAQITLSQPAQIRAMIVGDTAVCAGQSARLRFAVTGATNFSLVFSDGVTNTTVTNTETLVTPTTQTIFKLVSVQSGACLGAVSGSATVQIMTVPPPTLISILRDSLCGGSDLVITTPPSALPNVQYVWQTPTGVVPTTTPTLTIRNVNSSHSGLYTLKFAVNTCQSAATPSLRVTVLDLPTQGVFGGDDKVVCGGTTAQLSAQTIASQHITGNWIALDGAIITQPNVSNTTVSGLKTGNNRLVWSLTSSICGKIGTPDTVNLFVEKTPAALEKQFVLEGTVGSILINVKGLIQDSSNAKFTLTASISNVSMTPDNHFILFKRGDLKDAQTIEIPYQICSERCASLCASSKLFINVNKLIVPTDKIVVDTLFITNSSSKPSLEIQNIDKYEENEVLIFDRWGVRVFGPINYINGEFPKHAWDGKKDGQSLPNGAYYYIIKFKGKEQKQPERGVIYVVEGL